MPFSKKWFHGFHPILSGVCNSTILCIFFFQVVLVPFALMDKKTQRQAELKLGSSQLCHSTVRVTILQSFTSLDLKCSKNPTILTNGPQFLVYARYMDKGDTDLPAWSLRSHRGKDKPPDHYHAKQPHRQTTVIQKKESVSCWGNHGRAYGGSGIGGEMCRVNKILICWGRGRMRGHLWWRDSRRPKE